MKKFLKHTRWWMWVLWVVAFTLTLAMGQVFVAGPDRERASLRRRIELLENRVGGLEDVRQSVAEALDDFVLSRDGEVVDDE